MAEGLFGTSVSAPQLQQTRIQPAGTPGSTFVRPQQVQTGGNLRALTDALGSLNSSLNSFAQVKHQIENDPHSQDNKEWIAKRQQMTLDELLNDPDQDTQIRVRRDAFDALLGERAYADAVPMLETFFSTEFDRSTGDVEGEYDTRVSEIAERLPNEVSRGRFASLMQQHRARIIGGVTQERIEHTKQQVNTTIVDSWYTQLAEAGKNGQSQDPSKLAEEIFKSSASNRTFYGLSGQEQNATVWALAQRLAADGKVDEAEALLSTPRTGASGETIPALSTIPEYTSKSVSLVEAARTQRAKAADKGSAQFRKDIYDRVTDGTLTVGDLEPHIESGLISEAQAASYAAQAQRNRDTARTKAGMAAAAERAESSVITQAREKMDQIGGVHQIVDQEVPTASGGTRTITRKEQIETVTAQIEENLRGEEARLIEEEGMDPATAAKAVDEVRSGWYINRFVENPQWSREFKALPASVTPAALDKNPQLAARAAQQAERYLDLRAKSPAYADTLVDERSREFLESYAIARELRSLPPEEAVAMAAGITNMAPLDRVKTEIASKDKDSIIRSVIGETDAEVRGISRNLVVEQIDRLSALGVPAGEIKESLGNWAKERTTSINGVMVPVTRGMDADFPLLVEKHLQKVFKERGELYGIEDEEDISIAPVHGENYWMVIDKRTGLPLGSGHITPKVLEGLRSERRAELDAEIAENLKAAEADASERKQRYEDRLSWYDNLISRYERQGSRYSRWQADNLRQERQDYVNRNDPEWIKSRDKADEERLKEILRGNAERMGLPVNSAEP